MCPLQEGLPDNHTFGSWGGLQRMITKPTLPMQGGESCDGDPGWARTQHTAHEAQAREETLFSATEIWG